MKTALTIAGSDSSGGAGVQADLKTFQAHGVYGFSVITSVTAQNSIKIKEAYDLPAKIVRAQLEALFEDFEIQAVKTGMLSSVEIIETIAKILVEHRVKNILVDPVLVSKSGFQLLKKEAIQTLKEKLLPLALLVTPNLEEAEILSGIKINSLAAMKEAAKKIGEFTRCVLIKGGHASFQKATDLLWDGASFQLFEGKYIANKNPHGTGCVYSAAITANLALGHSPLEAIANSKKFIQKRINHAVALGHGNPFLIP